MHMSRPAHNKRNAGATLEQAIFATAKWTCGFMAADLFIRAILVTVIQRRAIVTAQYDQRAVREFQLVEQFENHLHARVEFHDRITPRPHAGLADKTRVRRAWHMDVVRSKVKEERLIF